MLSLNKKKKKKVGIFQLHKINYTSLSGLQMTALQLKGDERLDVKSGWFSTQ